MCKSQYDLSQCAWRLKGTAPYVPLRENSMETGKPLEGITGWIPAQVPGGVALALYRAGYIPHPYAGMNSLQCEWIENKWWIYEAEIELPPQKSERVRLDFEGVDYACSVYWNGTLLGSHTGMFEPFGFDVTALYAAGGKAVLRVLIRQPLVFPEVLPLLQALEQFRNARTHFAFVVDEFGSVEGIVTLSDVMETIAGNLPNEVEEIDARHDIQHHQDGSWTVNGHMPLEDLVQYVPLPLDDKREYHTVAGLLMEYLQHVPQVGETIEIDGYTLRTLQVDSHRVQKVQIVPPVKQDELDYEV